MHRRKPGELIARELSEDAERAQHARQPAPARALLDEREKARCAELMQHRGDVPELSKQERALLERRRAPPPPRSRCAALMLPTSASMLVQTMCTLNSAQKSG